MSGFFDEVFAEQPVMAILRGLPLQHTVELCELLWSRGVRAVEIPVQSSEAYETLGAVIETGSRHGAVVGAGTVLTMEQLERVSAMGAAFVVSPGYDPAMTAASEDRGLAHLPGVATATEISRAWTNGLRWLKAFPARELGASWFGAMLGPFPGASFVATGGVSAANAGELLAAGASAVSVGSAIAEAGEIDRVLAAVHRDVASA